MLLLVRSDSQIWCVIIAKALCDWTFPVVVVLSIPTGWVSNNLKHQYEHLQLSVSLFKGGRRVSISGKCPLCPFQAYGCTSFLSLSKVYRWASDNYTVYPEYFHFGKIFLFLFFLFCSFFQDCQFLMRVRVCCLASAWLAPLGRRFREAEMSVVDSRSLFPECRWTSSPSITLISSEWIQRCGFTLLSGQGRYTGTHSPSLFFLMEYKQTRQSSPSYTWSCDPRGRNTVEPNLFHCQWKRQSPALFLKKTKRKQTHTQKKPHLNLFFSEARCQTQSSDHELTLPQLTDTGFSQWKTVAAAAWACLFIHHSTI